MINIEINPNKEYILAGDISASMSNPDQRCDGLSRYNYMLEKFKSFVKIACDFDPHGGPTVMLFGQHVKVFEHTNLATIDNELSKVVFEGLTNTDLLLDKAFEEHREEKGELAQKGQVHPGTCLMVFTDGVPTNLPAVERAVLRIANNIDRQDEFDIVFLTVGTVDDKTSTFLKNLQSGTKFNIVSVKELDNVSFLAATE